MKKLSQFLFFDWDSFSEGKRYMGVGRKDWKDYESGELLGSKIDAVIVQDKTKYELAEGEIVSNLYERFTIKVPRVIDIPMNVEIQLKNVEATVYGDFRNQLSVIAEDVLVVTK